MQVYQQDACQQFRAVSVIQVSALERPVPRREGGPFGLESRRRRVGAIA